MLPFTMGIVFFFEVKQKSLTRELLEFSSISLLQSYFIFDDVPASSG